jgi:hypothetical protein
MALEYRQQIIPRRSIGLVNCSLAHFVACLHHASLSRRGWRPRAGKHV